jgi:hypothetical protein
MLVSLSRHAFQSVQTLSSPVDLSVQRRQPANAVAETIVRFDPKAKPAEVKAKPVGRAAAKPQPVAGWELPAAVPSLHDGIEAVREIGGRKDGTEPTRYGDWEKNGRCIDF